MARMIRSLDEEIEARAARQNAEEDERKRAQAEAWDECVDEAEGRGWIHDYVVSEMYKRNPYRGETQ